MKLSDFNYHLPTELIAHFPPAVRGDSRLLVLDRTTGTISHQRYANIVDHLNSGDVLILNNTKVIRARLMAQKPDGKQIEIFLLEKHDDNTPKSPNSTASAPYCHCDAQQGGQRRLTSLAGDPHVTLVNGVAYFSRRLGVYSATKQAGVLTRIIYRGKLHENEQLTIGEAQITVQHINDDGTAVIISDTNLDCLADQHGSVPLPPYMKRVATTDDTARYQTVFAEHRGSVAAPTASLNMTAELLQKIRDKGVTIAYLTLHVGLGTFSPIKTDDLASHHMHSEYFCIPAETITAIRNAKQQGRSVVALGTTVTRALEYAHADILDNSSIKISRGEANIFIYPGYDFKVIDKLITNFHAPKSTVLMLTAAFAGWDNLKNAYGSAVENKYSFLSYGDSMLIQ